MLVVVSGYLLARRLAQHLRGHAAGWMDEYPRLELDVVIVVPVAMNCAQFWLQDTFLKGKSEERQALQTIELVVV